MLRFVAACLALGVTLLFVVAVSPLWNVAMSFFRDWSDHDQVVARAVTGALSVLMLAAAAGLIARDKRKRQE